jgi:hypothetical protein
MCEHESDVLFERLFCKAYATQVFWQSVAGALQGLKNLGIEVPDKVSCRLPTPAIFIKDEVTVKQECQAASGQAASGPAASGPASSGPAASGLAASGPAASGLADAQNLAEEPVEEQEEEEEEKEEEEEEGKHATSQEEF